MKVISCLLLLCVPVFILGSGVDISESKKSKKEDKPVESVYKVSKLKESLKIDANWEKPQWKKIKSVKIENYIKRIPSFKPIAEAKMMYDKENIYVIFHIKDHYVRSVVQEYNGPVSGDSCVEFFFAPNSSLPLQYFNLEVNAGGTPLIYFITYPYPSAGFVKLQASEINEIEIAHSMPKVVDPEITEPVSWTIEYRIPLSLLEKYSNVTRPKPGIVWKANFYKVASKDTANPHYLTWASIDYPKPHFHLPQFFGTLKFQ